MEKEFKITIILGKTIEEWHRAFDGCDFWDYSFNELDYLAKKAEEDREDKVYWLIDDRLYEAE